MSKRLPERPSLDHLKSQAKDLLDGYKKRTPEALARFRDALPSVRGADDAELVAAALALHDAQSAIAREYGFESWNDLRAHVEQIRSADMTPEALRALMERQLGEPLPAPVEKALLAAAGERDDGIFSVDAPIPMVPIRNAMLTRGAVAPIGIGRPRSFAAVEEARAGARTLVTFAQRDATNEAPSTDDLHPVGTVVRLISTVPSDRGFWIILRAIGWVRLEAIVGHDPYIAARVSVYEVAETDDDEVKGLAGTLRERVRSLTATMPDGERIQRMTERMSPMELADATVANLPVPVDEKVRYAALPALTDRLRFVLALTAGAPTSPTSPTS